MAGPGVVTLQATIGRRPRRAALVGNPNVGKSSLFNVLTGLRQRIGNYPGITVERVAGTMSVPGGAIEILDLPGAYSLLPRSPDERVTRDTLAGRGSEAAPDVVVVVVDAANLERSLFLTTQVIETGMRVIVALNQLDVALAQGVSVDAAALAEHLGVPVIKTCGRTGGGGDALSAAIAAGGHVGRTLALSLPGEAVECANSLAAKIGADDPESLVGALCSAGAAAAWLERSAGRDAAAFRAARDDLAARGIDVETATATARYAAIEALTPAVTRTADARQRWQARLDRVLTHPYLGTFALLAIFLFLFLVVFSWSGPAIDFVDEQMGAFGAWLGGLFGTGLMASFVEDGVVAGLGAFLVFVPQIAMLFICIEALEDSGYLARAAFLLDRVMGGVGLPGRAFLPLLSGFACAIPGIMATRAIESRRDRLVTMAILPLMSCQARLPVYAVVVGALFTSFGGWVPSVVVISMYALGIVTAAAVAKGLRLSVLPGARSPLLLELPPYRMPAFSMVLRNTARRTWSFVAGAGPIIVVLTIALWATLTFPQDVELTRDFGAETAAIEQQMTEATPAQQAGLSAQIAELRTLESSEQLRGSYMGRAGVWIEPVIEPLGFDWKIGVAVIGSFAAREVFVPTLGVVYSVGEVEAEDAGLLASMRSDRWPDGRPVFTPLVGISLLVFYVIALQCASTLAVLKRETNSWRWPIWLFLGYTGLAYLASLVVYQVGLLLGY